MGNARFYNPDTLELVTQVPLAKAVKEKDGTVRTMKEPNITDARKLGLLPSVTSILDEVLAKGQMLMDWQIDQVLDACINFPFNRPKVEEEVKAYKMMIIAKAEEFRNHTADRGKLIHALVKNWINLRTVPDDPAALKAVGQIDEYLKGKKVIKVSSEETLGSKKAGFAGTPDINAIKEDKKRLIIDMKSVSFKNFKKPYDSWKFQLGGYDILTESEPGTELIQCVIDRDIGDCLFLPHEKGEDLKAGFRYLFGVWCIMKDYNPKALTEVN